MGLLVWGVYSATSALIEPTTFLNDLLIVIVPVIAGAASFLGLCVALSVEELDYARAVVGRRFASQR
jgi:hypothetical protein